MRTCRSEAIRLAQRIRDLQTDLADNRAALDGLVADQAPELLDLTGIRSVFATTVLAA